MLRLRVRREVAVAQHLAIAPAHREHLDVVRRRVVVLVVGGGAVASSNASAKARSTSGAVIASVERGSAVPEASERRVEEPTISSGRRTSVARPAQ